MTTASQAVATISADGYNQSIMEFLQHGDITKLPIAAQVRLYEEKCRAIGMKPMDRPFSIISFRGKATLYLTANACNTFAAMVGIQRDIIGKPSIETLEGKKAIYIHIKGTLKGRSEEDHYWRELKDEKTPDMPGSPMVQMSKAQSAARRRITMIFMSPAALQGVISEDDIFQLGLDATKTDEEAVNRIVDASAPTVTVTEEKTETEPTQKPTETKKQAEEKAAQLQKQIVGICEQFSIDPTVVKHWRLAIGLKQTFDDLSKVIKLLTSKDDRARPYVYTFGIKNLITPDVIDYLFAQKIQHKEPGISSWLEFWQKIQSNQDDWAVKLADLATEAEFYDEVPVEA